MNEKINFAIVGCGNIAQRHAPEAVVYGNLAAVCDINKAKADALAQKYNCRACYSFEDLLKGPEHPDVISICTPNWLHAPQAIQAMEAGFHVLCEKPMAISLQEAQLMAATAERTKKRLFVVKQNRYNPPIEFVKSLIKENKLGHIYSFQVNGFWNRPEAYYQDWRGKKSTDGGTLYTQFSHFIDIITWLCGPVAETKFLSANLAHPYIEFEDTGIVHFKMVSGAIGSFHYTVNSFKKNMEGSVTLFAEHGTVKIGGQYLNELEYFNVKDIDKPQLPIGNGANQYGFYQGSMSNHDKIYSNLVRALHDSTHPMLEADEAVQTVEIIESIYNQVS